MKGKQVRFSVRSAVALLLAGLVMILAVAPALADAPESDIPGTAVFGAGTCPGYEVVFSSHGSYAVSQVSNAMGREGGALVLLGVGHNTRIAAPITMGLSSVYDGHAATFTVIQDTSWLGREGGALGLLGVGQD